jgi:formylglycine-generating enzyme required for sulfatase activity
MNAARDSIALGVLIAVTSMSAFAQVDPLSGIDFVTITSPGNAAWGGNGSAQDQAVGRGSVGYEYRIGKFEVTTSQWAEFMNAAFDRPQSEWISHLLPPGQWGAAGTTPNTPGGRRWFVPAGNEMRGVGGIDWRMAAIYCNWLHNNKSLDRSAFLSGAYDVSTFAYVQSGPFTVFTDQRTRSEGARYFIPTWDEWLKAAHYDPNKANNDGTTGGWWLYSNGSDSPFVPGPPGELVNGQLATANFGFQNAGDLSCWSVPLGSYAGVQSPWGLVDTAGMTQEWTEEALGFIDVGYEVRRLEGSSWGDNPAVFLADSVSFGAGSAFPTLNFASIGFRIASVVPGSGTLISVAVGVMLVASRRRTTR